MATDAAFLLRQRFLPVIRNKWVQNDHDLKEVSCVYAMTSTDYFTHETDIVYIGSTTKLFSRYKSHKIPGKIQAMDKINIMYFIPMKKGFYDYEIKLIRKLKPVFNKQHK